MAYDVGNPGPGLGQVQESMYVMHGMVLFFVHGNLLTMLKTKNNVVTIIYPKIIYYSIFNYLVHPKNSLTFTENIESRFLCPQQKVIKYLVLTLLPLSFLFWLLCSNFSFHWPNVLKFLHVFVYHNTEVKL
jgi:hypothetical protein